MRLTSRQLLPTLPGGSTKQVWPLLATPPAHRGALAAVSTQMANMGHPLEGAEIVRKVRCTSVGSCRSNTRDQRALSTCAPRVMSTDTCPAPEPAPTGMKGQAQVRGQSSPRVYWESVQGGDCNHRPGAGKVLPTPKLLKLNLSLKYCTCCTQTNRCSGWSAPSRMLPSHPWQAHCLATF